MVLLQNTTGEILPVPVVKPSGFMENSFDKGGDLKAPFGKACPACASAAGTGELCRRRGRAQRGGIWKRYDNEENIRQQYLTNAGLLLRPTRCVP